MTPAGALCSLHPLVEARAACGRCGRFACDACLNKTEPPWCHQCDDGRYGEWARGPYSLAIVLEQGLQLFAKNAHLALGLAVLTGLSDMLLGASDLVGLPFVQIVLQVVMDAFCTAAFLLCLNETVLARTPVAADVIGNAVGALPRVLGVTIGYTLLAALGMLLLVVPGIYLLGLLSLCQVVAVLEPGKGALKTSSELLRGRVIGPLVVQVIVVSAYVGIAASSKAVELWVLRGGRGAWAVSLAGGISHSLVGCAADAMLFCIWLRLRHGPQHSVA